MQKYIPVVVIKEMSETDKILTALKKSDIMCIGKRIFVRKV